MENLQKYIYLLIFQLQTSTLFQIIQMKELINKYISNET